MSDLVKRSDVLGDLTDEFAATPTPAGFARSAFLGQLKKRMRTLPAISPHPASPAAIAAQIEEVFLSPRYYTKGLNPAQDVIHECQIRTVAEMVRALPAAAPDPVQAAAVALAEAVATNEDYTADDFCPGCMYSLPDASSPHRSDCPLVAFRRAREGRTT